MRIDYGFIVLYWENKESCSEQISFLERHVYIFNNAGENEKAKLEYCKPDYKNYICFL